MALQISEIGVRVAVGEPPADAVRSTVDAVSAGAGADGLSAAQRAEIVQACVSEVLRTLRMLEAR